MLAIPHFQSAHGELVEPHLSTTSRLSFQRDHRSVAGGVDAPSQAAAVGDEHLPSHVVRGRRGEKHGQRTKVLRLAQLTGGQEIAASGEAGVQGSRSAERGEGASKTRSILASGAVFLFAVGLGGVVIYRPSSPGSLIRRSRVATVRAPAWI